VVHYQISPGWLLVSHPALIGYGLIDPAGTVFFWDEAGRALPTLDSAIEFYAELRRARRSQWAGLRS
jgi:hypothetical protein